MNELNETALTSVSGGGDLPATTPYLAPSEAYIAWILSLLAPRGTAHASD